MSALNSSGLNPDTINKSHTTAQSVNQMMQSSTQRIELIARSFAEGVKEICDWYSSEDNHFEIDPVMNEKIETTDQAVRYFHNLLLRVPLSLEHETWLTAFLNRELGTKNIRTSITYLEEPLRMLIHLIMSTPEYQLS